MIKVSIIGASGYTGGELLRLLLNHQEVELAYLVGFSTAGEDAGNLFPYLRGLSGKKISAMNIDAVTEGSDVIFLAMPHGQAVAPVAAALAKGKKVIDLGADFRFDNAKVYEEWYKVKHDNHALCKEAVYGLPEIFRAQIKNAALIANPGCFPTASLLALYPLLKAGLVKPDTVIIDAKSGVSGAGKKPLAGNIYCEAAESLKAYGVATHRHTPEIERIIGEISGIKQVINFTPHLTPMSRGILATVYANLNCRATSEELNTLYQMTYQDEEFVFVHPEGRWPQTKWACGANTCHIALTFDERTQRVIITAVIDNLLKGASGQAVQNMNLMFDLPENTGLKLMPLVP